MEEVQQAPTKWCPSCKTSLQTLRETCPKCLADLTSELRADIACPSCGHMCPGEADACSQCLASLPTADSAVAMAELLARGHSMPRPAAVAPFRDGAKVTLRRIAHPGSLMFTGRDGLIEAYVESNGFAAQAPLFCRDFDGANLFRVVPYVAKPNALVAFDATDRPLAIYEKGENPANPSMLVRDETSAPAATLKPDPKGEFTFVLVETGGGVIAGVQVTDTTDKNQKDDMWSLHVIANRLPYELYGAIGMLIAAKCFFGRTRPQAIAAPASDEASELAYWPPFCT